MTENAGMEDKDIDAFIKAKKELAISELLTVATMLPLAVLMFINGSGIGSQFEFPLIMLAFCLLVFSHGSSKWVAITRRQLIDIIERQINRDPVALQRLATKQEPRKHLA